MTCPRLEVHNLHHTYPSSTKALQGINLTIEPGEFVALVGQNGSGKTTLAKHFNGLLRPTQGHIALDGLNTAKISISQLAQQVGYVFQNPDHQIFSPTVREEIGIGPINLGLSETEVATRVNWAMSLFRLEPYAEKQPAILGIGLRRKVGVAAIFAMQAPILVLDEPTAGLDQRGVDELLGHIRMLHQAGHTIILITHDMRLVAEYVPRTIVLHQGRVLIDGETRAVFKQTEHLKQAHLDVPQITDLSRRLQMPDDALSVSDFCQAYLAKINRDNHRAHHH